MNWRVAIEHFVIIARTLEYESRRHLCTVQSVVHQIDETHRIRPGIDAEAQKELTAAKRALIDRLVQNIIISVSCFTLRRTRLTHADANKIVDGQHLGRFAYLGVMNDALALAVCGYNAPNHAIAVGVVRNARQ